MNGTTYDDDGAYPIGPHSSTNVPIDGINVQGTVIKVTNGSHLVTINPTGVVDLDYTGALMWDLFKATLFSGTKSNLPANNWINLWNSINSIQ